EELRIDPLERRAFRRAVALPVERRAEHVAIAREGPEVQRVVPIERRMIAQPAIRRVRILVELVRERIELHRAHFFWSSSIGFYVNERKSSPWSPMCGSASPERKARCLMKPDCPGAITFTPRIGFASSRACMDGLRVSDGAFPHA